MPQTRLPKLESALAAEVYCAIMGFFTLLFLLAPFTFAEEWQRFRGPNGSGISTDTGFPSEFGVDKNIVWKTPVRPGKSSPVLTGQHVFLTGHDQNKLFTQCFDRKSGRLLWEQSVERVYNEVANALNNPAAISPVTDGQNVYVFFKDFGIVSYDATGKLRWKTPLGPFVTSMGLGASPIVSGENVIVVADQLEGSFIAAFDRRNGETRWKIARSETEGWGSPLLYPVAGASPFVLTTTRGVFGAHLASNGKRVLNQEGLGSAIVASPVLATDTVYAFGYGSDTPSPFDNTLKKYDKNHDGQVTPDEYGTDPFVHGIGAHTGNKDGIVTKEKWDAKQRAVMGPNRLTAVRLERDPMAPNGVRSRELWKYDKNFTGVIPSPLVYDGVLYVIRNGGILTSFDAVTGEVLKTGRLPGALSGYSSSPVAADGKIYFPSEDGKIGVVKAGRDWEVLAVNDIAEPCFATPALSQGHLYLRTSEALYRIGTKR